MKDLPWSCPPSHRTSSCASLLQWGCGSAACSARTQKGHKTHIFGQVQALCVLGEPQHPTGLSQLKTIRWFLGAGRSGHGWGGAGGLRSTTWGGGYTKVFLPIYSSPNGEPLPSFGCREVRLFVTPAAPTPCSRSVPLLPIAHPLPTPRSSLPSQGLTF